jgi:hypothetical protein
VSEARRNLGTTKQAAAIHGVTQQTVHNWRRQGLISAVRVGGGAYKYDLDSVARLAVEYPCAATDERIRELVADAPELSTSQINKLRLLIHAGGGAPDGGAA